MVNSTSANVGRWQTTPGEDIPAEGTVSLSSRRFSPRPRILLGQDCRSTCLAQEMGHGSEVGPTVCPMVYWRNAERVRERCGQACEILAQEQSCLPLRGRIWRASLDHVSRTRSRGEQIC